MPFPSAVAFVVVDYIGWRHALLEMYASDIVKSALETPDDRVYRTVMRILFADLPWRVSARCVADLNECLDGIRDYCLMRAQTRTTLAEASLVPHAVTIIDTLRTSPRTELYATLKEECCYREGGRGLCPLDMLRYDLDRYGNFTEMEKWIGIEVRKAVEKITAKAEGQVTQEELDNLRDILDVYKSYILSKKKNVISK